MKNEKQHKQMCAADDTAPPTPPFSPKPGLKVAYTHCLHALCCALAGALFSRCRSRPPRTTSARAHFYKTLFPLR